jgi:hypothetical protein
MAVRTFLLKNSSSKAAASIRQPGIDTQHE